MYHGDIEGDISEIRDSHRRSWIRSEPHSHILGAPPRMSPLRIISIIKSISARQIFQRFPDLKKKELWGGEFWSDGKYIGTVGEATSEKTIRNYIRNQSPDKKTVENRMRQLKFFGF